ncbi:AMP-binding protein [Nesterenkonia flava]|uniref:AMP-binding protein n=1 Tax=Nesterenkonia flava TaxID=469799 RepID=A0ABU1FRB5_9MICC|nr:AMP-binding protein [Nesterenkonia flava]MDR5711158.1 AMP-binding protein [Nesterenkonia flava]
MSAWVGEALAALEAALAGRTPPLEFLPAEQGAPPRWVERPDVHTVCRNWGNTAESTPEPAVSAHSAPAVGQRQTEGQRPAVVVRTSGSTGTPKQTLLSAAALRASAQMTAEHLAARGWGGHGQWLLTLQPSYVAGLAVLSRSLEAGTEPVPLLEHTTDPEAFAHAAEQLTAQHRYVSLVPTQLTRLLNDAERHPRLRTVLQRFDAILLGGGASSPQLLGTAQDAGLRVMRTYGMSETCGGCVYDGVPLPGVGIEVDDAGRVLLSGPQVALGYLDEQLSAERFDADASGRRRFLTDDLGVLTDGVLSITGRADDVINTGGVKVSAEKVRQALEADPEIREAFVTGVEDPEWGQRVAAVVVLERWPEDGSSPSPHSGTEEAAVRPPEERLTAEWLAALNAGLRQQLGPAAVPKSMRYLCRLPRLSSGKPDRQAMRRMFSDTN